MYGTDLGKWYLYIIRFTKIMKSAQIIRDFDRFNIFNILKNLITLS